jgi:hypothetical protein
VFLQVPGKLLERFWLRRAKGSLKMYFSMATKKESFTLLILGSQYFASHISNQKQDLYIMATGSKEEADMLKPSAGGDFSSVPSTLNSVAQKHSSTSVTNEKTPMFTWREAASFYFQSMAVISALFFGAWAIKSYNAALASNDMAYQAYLATIAGNKITFQAYNAALQANNLS